MQLIIKDKREPVKTVCVVTPTIGKETLDWAITNVYNQTYKHVKHLLVIDGPEYSRVAYDAMYSFRDHVSVIQLPENIGKGWYGHRVYAAIPFLVNADAIVYLDEDNWFWSNHIETLVNTLNAGDLDFAHSLRTIHDSHGNFICDDNCESLGHYPAFLDNYNHIDTSSLLVRRDFAVKVSHAWYGKWGADRQFFNFCQSVDAKYEGTGKHSAAYRLGGNQGSVQEKFFLQGNEVMKMRYPNGFPWVKT